MSRTVVNVNPIKVGQRWCHVGGDGVPGTGLIVEIVEEPKIGKHGWEFWVVYPELKGGYPRRYSGASLGSFWASDDPRNPRERR